MKNCKLLVGVTLQALEGQINAVLAEDESAQLVGLMFAQGSGFVAAMVREAREAPPIGTTKNPEQPKRPGRSKTKT